MPTPSSYIASEITSVLMPLTTMLSTSSLPSRQVPANCQPATRISANASPWKIIANRLAISCW